MDKPRSLRAKLSGIGFVLAGLLACSEVPGAPPPPAPPPPPPAPQNAAPVANAGSDLTVSAGLAVTLDGAASSDADGDQLTYTWSFASVPAGSAAALDDDASATPSFTPDVAGGYVLQLVVNDGTEDGAADQATVTAQDNTATLTIGAGGGDIASSDGRAVLSIPAGALSADTEIRITKWMRDQYPVEWQGFSDQALVYNFAPDGTQFATPARLTVTTNAPAVNEDGDVEAELGLLVDLVGGEGEPLANLVTEANGAENRITVSADVAHFSEVSYTHHKTITVETGSSATPGGLIVSLRFDADEAYEDGLVGVSVAVHGNPKLLDVIQVSQEDLSDPDIPWCEPLDLTFKRPPESDSFFTVSRNCYKLAPNMGSITLLRKVTVTFNVRPDQKIKVGNVIVQGRTFTKEFILSQTISPDDIPKSPDFGDLGVIGGERLARILFGGEEVVAAGGTNRVTVFDKDGTTLIDAVRSQVDFFGGMVIDSRQLVGVSAEGVFGHEPQAFPPVDDLISQKLQLELTQRVLDGNDNNASATDIMVYGDPGSEVGMVSRFEAKDFLFLDSELKLTIDPEVFDDDQGESVFGDKGPISGYVSPNGFTENDPMLAVLVDPVTKDTQLDVVTLATDQDQRRAVSTKAFDLQGEGRMVRCQDGICATSSRGTPFGFGAIAYFIWDGEADPVLLQSMLGRANGIDLAPDGNGNVMVASTNIDASLVNVMLFGTDGTLLGSASEPAPEGCTRPEHTVFRPAPQGGVPTEVLLMCSEEEIQATAFTIINF